MLRFFNSLGFIFFLLSCSSNTPKIGYEDKLINKRKFFESSFKGAKSILEEEDKASFRGLSYFSVDTNYRVLASIKWDLKCSPVKLVTDSAIESYHYPSAFLTFNIKGKQLRLQGFTKTLKGIKNVFIPFYDLTSGNETYGGGRYLDAELKSSKALVLDFNLAYNPYCSYNPSYICAVPPMINELNFEIFAGEKLPKIDNH